MLGSRQRWILRLAVCTLPALLLLLAGCGQAAKNDQRPTAYSLSQASGNPSSETQAPAEHDSAVETQSLEGPVGGGAPPPKTKLEKDLKPPPPPPWPPAEADASSNQDSQIEKDLANLKNNGNLAYFTPEKMKTGGSATVTARIGFANLPASALTSGIAEGQSGQTQVEPTPVTTRMKMTLSSADFNITPLSSEEQMVGGVQPTEWQWQISPKHAGTLHLHLAAIIEIQNFSRDYTTVDRDITVQVSPINALASFIGAHIEWILGSLGSAFTALVAWWWKQRKKKKRQRKTSKVAVP